MSVDISGEVRKYWHFTGGCDKRTKLEGNCAVALMLFLGIFAAEPWLKLCWESFLSSELCGFKAFFFHFISIYILWNKIWIFEAQNLYFLIRNLNLCGLWIYVAKQVGLFLLVAVYCIIWTELFAAHSKWDTAVFWRCAAFLLGFILLCIGKFWLKSAKLSISIACAMAWIGSGRFIPWGVSPIFQQGKVSSVGEFTSAISFWKLPLDQNLNVIHIL